MNKRTERWMQDLFDLMANEKITLEVGGEMGDVDAVLYVWHGKEKRDVATVIAAETFDDAMCDLMEEAKR